MTGFHRGGDSHHAGSRERLDPLVTCAAFPSNSPYRGSLAGSRTCCRGMSRCRLPRLSAVIELEARMPY
jgi:hypothetical protein